MLGVLTAALQVPVVGRNEGSTEDRSLLIGYIASLPFKIHKKVTLDMSQSWMLKIQFLESGPVAQACLIATFDLESGHPRAVHPSPGQTFLSLCVSGWEMTCGSLPSHSWFFNTSVLVLDILFPSYSEGSLEPSIGGSEEPGTLCIANFLFLIVSPYFS